jgi:3-hexulose-6-phosphate synthase / 6-phospho-3-hexuloisomerase
MSKQKLQLALDFIDLEEAVTVAKKAAPYVDIMEAGTPLIKAVGLEAVRRLKKEFPDKIINADMKTADVGDLEAKMAAESGANIVTVMGAAPIETVLAAVKEGKNHQNFKVAADTIGVKNISEKAKEIEETGADYLLIHCGIDEQKTGKDPIENVKIALQATKRIAVIACGGINAETAKNFKEMERVEIVIVGGGITRAKDPEEAAKKIKEALL